MSEKKYPKRSGRKKPISKKPTRPQGALRVATYTRISTDEENQPYSLQAQAQMLGKYIESQPDLVHVASYTDQKSGATLNRDDLERLLQDAEKGVFDVVLVYRLDRLARSLNLVHQILERLQKNEVGLRSATEPFDTITAGGRMMMNILATFAQFERDVLIDRITAGMLTKASRGEWPGGQAPYGYRIRDGKVLEIVESEAAVIRRIFKMVDEDRLGSIQIAEALNASGARTLTGQLWSFKRVLDALRRPTYAGWIVRQDEVFKGLHEPIIDQETFDRVQAILDSRVDPTTRRSASEFILSGLVRCAMCNRTVVGVSGHGRSAKYRYYVCAGRNEKGSVSCASKRISADALESMVREQIIDLYGQYDLFERAAKKAVQRRSSRRPVIEAELEAAKSDLHNNDLATRRYFTAFEEGTMPEKLCAERLTELRDKSGVLRSRIAELEYELAAKPPKIPTPAELVKLRKRVVEALNEPPSPAQRAFLASVIDHIEVGGNRAVKCFLRVPRTAEAISDPEKVAAKKYEPGFVEDPGSHSLMIGGDAGNRTRVRNTATFQLRLFPFLSVRSLHRRVG